MILLTFISVSSPYCECPHHGEDDEDEEDEEDDEDEEDEDDNGRCCSFTISYNDIVDLMRTCPLG